MTNLSEEEGKSSYIMYLDVSWIVPLAIALVSGHPRCLYYSLNARPMGIEFRFPKVCANSSELSGGTSMPRDPSGELVAAVCPLGRWESVDFEY